MTLVQENIYRRTDAGTVGWDDELDAVLLRWHGFATSESFRAHMELCIELLEATGANKMYADARNQGAISDEDKLWSITEWATQADEAGLEALVIVYPESVIAKMSVDSVIEQVDDDIERLITDDVTEGRNWLADHPATVTDVVVSELEEPTLDVEPTSDTDEKTETIEREDDDVSTEPDSNLESPAESDADEATTSHSESDTETDTATADDSSTASTTSPGTSPDPLTVAGIGGIVGLLGVSVMMFVSGQVPALVPNALANAALLLGSVVLGGMALGWLAAEIVS
ncbi:hypothetical protein [Natronorubrum bangense]|uniref:Uncharacterized protein n=2 Tax=Natronorubrum bangense TaxID=61858 RepID=L9WMI7_9EURY|nr:hypothetical protein [Natronorubrum bangense]ELY50684.1 hypothetical protein C494_04875 [Natronorubrum bangense JCM 10635]QCC54422.1 hypothetical protein DV706_07930 [Natronorubrum bangense]